MAKPQTLELKAGDREKLEKIVKKGTVQAREARRARILLLKAKGESVDAIAGKAGVCRTTVLRCLKKYKEGGLERALHDDQRSGRPPIYTDVEKEWIIDAACQKPIDLSLAAAVWSTTLLTRYVKKSAESARLPRLEGISRSTVFRILDNLDIKPFRIREYCEKRDPDFEKKKHNIDIAYIRAILNLDEGVHTISVDELTGIVALGTTSPDLMPTKEHGVIKRDCEYMRFGMVTLIAGKDIGTGEEFALVSDTHKACDFIEFLKLLDARYPKGDKIRLVLDNLIVHKSKAVKAFLATMPGRFELVFTPIHGSWLNLVERFFSKIRRQLLRGLRVKSKEELVDLIYEYFRQDNESPVPFKWNCHMDEFDPSEKVEIGLAI